MKKLTNEQRDRLFELARQAKQKGETLTGVFKKIADENGLKSGSVRNFYYKWVSEGRVEGLTAKSNVMFTEKEEGELLRAILQQRRYNKTLNGALLAVANGDRVLALRYRNKFANMLKKKRQAVMKEVLFQKKLGYKPINPYVLKNNRDEKNKLKREIDELISIIRLKCAKENQLLKSKLIRYEQLTDGLDLTDDKKIL
ncbi:MAG: hypothetical protein IJW13_04645 [Clostridia bacterium]|nr:hypothetical protein [Clostridia bacterium]